MKLSSALSISPTDGRYADSCQAFRSVFSEYALVRQRMVVEIRWLVFLSCAQEIPEVPSFSQQTLDFLEHLIDSFDQQAFEKVKTIEKKINHDVKAVELYLKDQAKDCDELKKIESFWHFSCTSEDINNIAYSLMLQEGISVLLKAFVGVVVRFSGMANDFSEMPMLSRTHGQAASPTTMGKEMAVFGFRLYRQLRQLEDQPILGKFNGAVGNYNAHVVAYPTVDWPKLSERFVLSLGLQFNPFTTQIEPHDYCAELAHNFMRFNTICLDACRDIWSYVSLGYFKQRMNDQEVGSSTMPHKINPIDFENAEGNFGLANALLGFFAEKLPVSRLQRDLSDSTVQRNWGNVFAYMLIAVQSLVKGLNKLDLDMMSMQRDLVANPEILGEALQTVMRLHGVPDAYQIILEATRGKRFNYDSLQALIGQIDVSETDRVRLENLSVHTYLGNAPEQAKAFYAMIRERYPIELNLTPLSTKKNNHQVSAELPTKKNNHQVSAVLTTKKNNHQVSAEGEGAVEFHQRIFRS